MPKSHVHTEQLQCPGRLHLQTESDGILITHVMTQGVPHMLASYTVDFGLLEILGEYWRLPESTRNYWRVQESTKNLMNR